MFRIFFSGRTINRKDPLCLSTEVPDLEATENRPLFVKEILAFYDEPKPHFNTLSTIVRGLEEKGFLAHHTYGNTYQYYAVVSESDFSKRTLKSVISKYFNNCSIVSIV